jgi:uncharacterized protein YndB with AHSA1/START domain
MSTQAQDLTVRKSVTVACSPAEAFRLFTEGLETWWPFDTHCPGDKLPEEFVFEGHEGGRVFHRAAGAEYEWATVTAWEPPQHFAVDWHVTPGRPSTELEVRFVSEGDGTRVELEHRGWAQYGDDAADEHGEYDRGWDFVLGRYAAKAG